MKQLDAQIADLKKDLAVAEKLQEDLGNAINAADVIAKNVGKKLKIMEKAIKKNNLNIQKDADFLATAKLSATVSKK